MIIYIVFGQDWDDTEIYAVYDDEKRAISARKKLEIAQHDGYDHFVIEAWELNGERIDDYDYKKSEQ